LEEIVPIFRLVIPHHILRSIETAIALDGKSTSPKIPIGTIRNTQVIISSIEQDTSITDFLLRGIKLCISIAGDDMWISVFYSSIRNVDRSISTITMDQKDGIGIKDDVGRRTRRGAETQ